MWWKKLLMELGFALVKLGVKYVSQELRGKLVELPKQFRKDTLETPQKWDDIFAEGLYQLVGMDKPSV